jgi:preprotein translocase subunit YajC
MDVVVVWFSTSLSDQSHLNTCASISLNTFTATPHVFGFGFTDTWSLSYSTNGNTAYLWVWIHWHLVAQLQHKWQHRISVGLDSLTLGLSVTAQTATPHICGFGFTDTWSLSYSTNGNTAYLWLWIHWHLVSQLQHKRQHRMSTGLDSLTLGLSVTAQTATPNVCGFGFTDTWSLIYSTNGKTACLWVWIHWHLVSQLQHKRQHRMSVDLDSLTLGLSVTAQTATPHVCGFGFTDTWSLSYSTNVCRSDSSMFPISPTGHTKKDYSLRLLHFAWVLNP